MLHESREPYPCHTFRSDAAEIFTPPRSLKATHAQRCNSCRSGACPNVQIPYPCRLRRRQEPPKTCHNHCAARKWARPPCKTLCQPAARRSARDAGRQTTKSHQTPHPSPPPPRTPQYAALVRKKGGVRAGGLELGYASPLPLVVSFLLLGVYRQAN